MPKHNVPFSVPNTPVNPFPVIESSPVPPASDQFGAAIAPTEPAGVPAASPDDLVTRKAGWARFLERVGTDPALQQAFIKFGTQALQPIQPGQTGLGALSSALQTGVDTLSAKRAFRTETQRKAAELTLKERKTTAGETRAGAAKTIAGAAVTRADASTLRAEAAMKAAERGVGAIGVAAKVQENEQIAKALVAVGGSLYQGPGGKDKALLKAQEINKSKTVADRAAALAIEMLPFNATPQETEDAATLAVKIITATDKAAFTSRLGVDTVEQSITGVDTTDIQPGEEVWTNPETGERIVFRGGVWQPVR